MRYLSYPGSFVDEYLRAKNCLNCQITSNLLTWLRDFAIMDVSGHVTAHGTAHI
jgi:hypothetical protein